MNQKAKHELRELIKSIEAQIKAFEDSNYLELAEIDKTQEGVFLLFRPQQENDDRRI